MYSEIQAVVGFFSNFLYNKLPRRKVDLFSEQLANFLAQKFGTCWFQDYPQRKSNLRCIRVNVDSQMDKLISVAASCVGLELEEVAKHLPTELTIWVNPGEVTYRVGQCGTLMVLYTARNTCNSILNPTANGRSNCSDIPSVGQLRLAIEEQRLLTKSPTVTMGKQNGTKIQNGWDQSSQVHMNMNMNTNTNTGSGVYRRNIATGTVFDAAPGGPIVEQVIPNVGLNTAASPTFELRSPNKLQFTAASFAMTRFGTTKLKDAPAAVNRSKSPKRRHFLSGNDRCKDKKWIDQF